jgi:hypothetical protein
VQSRNLQPSCLFETVFGEKHAAGKLAKL